MTERREPPRIGTADGRPPIVAEDDPAPRRLGRLAASPAARRLVLSRVGRAATIGLALAALAVLGGSSLVRVAVEWLHRRPDYRVAFREIRLVPEPPPWIKGGREALLEQVRAGRDSLRSVSVLDARLDDLLGDFRRHPYIVRADRIVRAYPNSIAVGLQYREPVATIRVGDAAYPLDGEAVVLPRDGTELAKAAPLLEINAPRPAEPPGPGLPWPTNRSEGEAASILHAARLARFLKDQSARDPDLAERLRFQAIAISEAHAGSHDKYLWLLDANKRWLLWADLGKLGVPGELNDGEKWLMLRDWLGQKEVLQPAPDREFLRFTPRGVRLAGFKG